MKRLFFILILLPCLAMGGETEIYTLDNGMEVVLIENHSAPVIASSVIVRAGLRDEEADIIGASHFLEHLLFNGTSHRTQEEIYQEFDQLGGYNNAHTGENFANFVILMNKENFERGLEIQCDMLFNSTLPDLNFEKERGIVKEEIGQSQDEVSYQADIYFFQRFFQGTPYSFPVLGNEQSIENLQRSRVMEYYRSHYFPNNMLAIITGDFDLQQIKGLVDKYLGAPSAGKLPEREEFKLSLPGQPGLAPISYHYEKSDKVYLRIGVPAPSRFDNEYYTAEILGKLLEKRLQQSLTAGEKPSVQELSLEYFSERDFGAYILRASFKEQDKAAAVAEAFRQTFQDFQKSPVNINHLKNLIISEKTQSLLDSERPHFFAMMKAPLLAFHGYEFVLKYYEKLQSVSPEALKTLAGKVYNEGQFIPVVVKPYPVQVKTDSTGACAGVIHESLLNGLELIISPGSGSGVFAVHFLFKNRSASEPEGKTGITNFLHSLLLKGTEVRTETALNDAMEAIGMKLEVADNPYIPFDDYRTTPEFSFIRMEIAAENWRQGLNLTAEIIKSPALKPEAIEAVRGTLIAEIARTAQSASARSDALFKQKLFGTNGPGRSVNGDMVSISNITRKDLVEHYSRYMSPYNLILSIVGEAPADSVALEVIKLFGGMKSGESAPVSSSAPSSSPGEYREKLGKKQSYIRLGYLISEIPPEDEAPLKIAAEILGEKMAFQLRERQGLAYSISAEVEVRQGWGYFSAFMGTAPDNLETALAGLKEQIMQAGKGGFTVKEVERAANSFMGARNMRLLTSINRAYYLGIYAFKGLPLNYGEKWSEKVKAVSVDEVNRCAQKYFKLDNLVTVVVE